MSDPLTEAVDGLRQIYVELDAELAALAPPCRMRGHCCEGLGRDHHLYASALEVELLRRAAPRIVSEQAPPRCPFHAGGRCHARDGRPLGCRLYFCDPSWEASMESLSVRYHGRVRHLVERHGVPYGYRPFAEAVREVLCDVGAPARSSPAGRGDR